jgi:hypothetical protein
MVTNGNRMREHLVSEMSESAAATAANLAASGQEWLKVAQTFVAKRPVACLAGAFATGVVIAWFLKRTR